MSVPVSAFIGCFLGFAFGVGCSLAVLFSIYMGGYRAAVADAALPQPPPRLLNARKRLELARRAAALRQTADAELELPKR